MKSFFYIICIIGIITGLYFYNKKIKLNYKDFSVNNFNLYLECIALNIISLFFGKDYFSFSIYLVALIMIYLVYLKKDIRDIDNEEKRVKETFTYFSKHFIFIIFLNIPVFFISGLLILGYTFFSLVILSVIILMDTLNIIKKKETYKVMTQVEISNLFPNYDINNLYNAAFNTLVFIKTNYMNSRTDLNKDYLSEELFNKYKLKENENIAKSQKEMFEEFNYVSGNLVEYDKSTNTFKVEFIYSFKNYVIDLNGRVLSGTPQFPHRYTYVIEFKYDNKIIVLNEKLYNTI